ncbi:MAG: rhodanese-like domain-containing protein [Pseudomonadota bacterium]
MRASFTFICAGLMAVTGPALAAEPQSPAVSAADNPQIDFPAFVAMATAMEDVRADRLLDLAAFQAMATRSDTLLLDARSAQAFAEGHIAGAVNLPLPDFTAQSLAATIGPDRNRPILIYCNNNFVNDVAPVVRKAVSLALNIQTMINLHGYGYTNVYELGEAVDFTEPNVRWVASETG